jgi:hypothetical protein
MGHPQVEVLFFVLKVKSGNVGHRPNEQREQLCPAVEVPTQAKGWLEWATGLLLLVPR